MSFSTRQILTGTVVAFVACVGAVQAASARPLETDGQIMSQVNVPEREGVPQFNTAEVRGKIVSVTDEQIQVRTSAGSVVTYSISPGDRERNQLAVGDDVVLLVRQDTVVGINPSVTPTDSQSEVTSGAAGTAEQTGRVESQSSQSSQRVTRQSETRVQSQTGQAQTQTTPAPRPETQDNQPVRGLW